MWFNIKKIKHKINKMIIIQPLPLATKVGTKSQIMLRGREQEEKFE